MKILVTSYTFDASAKTITFTGYGSISLESVLLITNVTDNIIIYNFAAVGKGGTVATNVLTLDYDTTSMDDADDLQIFYDDTTISGDTTGLATSGKQDTGNASLASLEGKDFATQTTLALIKAKTDNLDTALSGIKTGTDKIPASPAQEHATAGSPHAARLTDGTAFYKATTPSDTQPVSASSLPLPTGAATLAEQQSQTTHLSGTATSLAVLDDWDESDRAKVNPIAGQAGVQGGSGTVNALTQRVVLATDVALPAGTNAIGKLAANSGVDIGDVDVASIAAGTNTIGDVGIKPRTSGGWDVFRSLDLDETEEDVKTSAGQLFGWYMYNKRTTAVYVKLYNATAANVTVGTTTPFLTIPLPPGAAANVLGETGIPFSTAITAAATTGVADSDTGAPAANDVVCNLFYK